MKQAEEVVKTEHIFFKFLESKEYSVKELARRIAPY